MSVTTFPRKATNGDSSPSSGRDIQSMVFFNTPVIELLYSGAEMQR